MQRRLVSTALLGGLLVLFAPSAWAACSGSSPSWTTTPDLSSLSTCIKKASNGDTITVSAGSATWTSELSFSKYLKIIASGTVTITDNSPGGDPAAHGGPPLINIVESSAGSIRLQDFTFVQGTAVHSGTAGILRLQPVTNGQPILITGNTFTQGTSGNAMVVQTNRGVVWNNVFTGVAAGSNCFNNTSAVRHKNTGLTASWTTAATFGDADTNGDRNFYFETNQVTRVAEAYDCDDNCRGVIRYNTFTNSGGGTHGTDTSGLYGGRYLEYYGNKFIKDTTPLPACNGTEQNVNGFIALRGGTALIHSNSRIDDPTGLGTWGRKNAIQIMGWNLRRTGGSPFSCWGTVHCTGCGYPFPHQPGWGYTRGGTTLNGPNCSGCPVSQDLEPIYIWNNTGGGLSNSPVVLGWGCTGGEACPNCNACPDVSTYIQLNRDYYVGTAKPGYTPYTYPHPLTGATSSTPRRQP